MEAMTVLQLTKMANELGVGQQAKLCKTRRQLENLLRAEMARQGVSHYRQGK